MAKVDWHNYLIRDPRVCGGRLTVKGTRVLVANILDSLAEGATREQVLAAFSSLQEAHIDAALAYAAELARDEAAVPLAS